jgi:hypothetical protein
MKNKKPIKLIISIVCIAFFLLLCVATDIINRVFDPFAEFVHRGNPNFVDGIKTISFQINPQTILTSLAKNETNIFSPLITTPDAQLEQYPILWQQSDYIKIATVAFDFQWKESQGDWGLSRMVFDTDCQDISTGFDYAIFTYYKGVWNGVELRYLGRQIEIHPQYHEVGWSGDAIYYPDMFNLESSIDLKNLKFEAGDIVGIAEKNGGNVARKMVNNKCSVYLILDGNEKRGWHVVYDGDESMLSIFTLYVNPYTGQIRQK